MSKKITPKTKVVYFDVSSQSYKVKRLNELKSGQLPMCSVAGFIDTVCKFFEEVHPNMKDNPMWHNENWASIRNSE